MAFPNPFDLRHHRFGSGEDLVEQFLSTFGSRKTTRNYRTDLRQFFGEEKVTRQVASQVKEDDVAEFLQARADSLKRTSLKRKIETVRSFFRWVAGQNLVDELPIKEEVNTGDLVDQVLNEARNTTEGEGHSPTAEESEEQDEGDSERSRGGPVPMELEPGSEVNLDRKPDPNPEKSSSPGNQSEAGASEAGADADPTPGSEHTESPLSEAPLSEAAPRKERQSRESSNDTSADPAAADEGPQKENSVEKRDTREEPIGEGGAEENSADDESTGENSGGEDQPSIPDWALAPGEAKEIDLRRGERVALVDLPDALRGALPQLRDPSGPEGLFIRCTNDLKVQIRRNLGQAEDSSPIEVTIEHRSLRRILRNEGDPSAEPTLRQAIRYLHGLNWTLPRRAYDLVGALPSPGDAEGPFSEERPRWRLEGAGDGLGLLFFVTQITGVLAEGFGIEKDEEVFVGL